MKTLVDILGTVFLTVGAVIGAGFISGRELLSFFGTDNFTVYLALAFILFSVCFYLVFSLSNKHKSLNELNQNLFKSPKLFDYAVKICCFISTAVMLSSIDEITKPISPFGLPVYSALALVTVALISKNGVKGAKTASLIIMPAVIITVNVIIILNGNVKLSCKPALTGVGVFKTLLYVSMNIFINLPPLCDGARRKNKPSLALIAVFSAEILCVQGALILGTINGAGGVENSALPFLASIGGKSTVLFSAVCLTAVFTSLASAFYPLYEFSKTKSRKFGVTVLSVLCFLTARLGVKNIIDCAYPLIGGFGVAYIIYCVFYGIRLWKKKK